MAVPAGLIVAIGFEHQESQGRTRVRGLDGDIAQLSVEGQGLAGSGVLRGRRRLFALLHNRIPVPFNSVRSRGRESNRVPLRRRYVLDDGEARVSGGSRCKGHGAPGVSPVIPILARTREALPASHQRGEGEVVVRAADHPEPPFPHVIDVSLADRSRWPLCSSQTLNSSLCLNCQVAISFQIQYNISINTTYL